MPWLMKAEPDSRIVKGKDVKFSVDDFEEMGESPWDGVRNHEAKNIMKERLKLGDRVLFYHSNCKVPGVFAIAEVSKEGYPDYTAWDASHPYFDPKSDSASPTWYMVSVKFVSRLKHPVTLAWIKKLVSLPSPPDDVAYIGKHGLDALKGMALVNRGRLSVQPVSDQAFEAIVAMGEMGGMDEMPAPKARKGKKDKTKEEEGAEDVEQGAKEDKEGTAAKEPVNGRKKTKKDHTEDEPETKPKKPKKEAKPKKEPKPAAVGTRRSSRLRG